ncbi:hypothetical protein [Streptomyces bullii]
MAVKIHFGFRGGVIDTQNLVGARHIQDLPPRLRHTRQHQLGTAHAGLSTSAEEAFDPAESQNDTPETSSTRNLPPAGKPLIRSPKSGLVKWCISPLTLATTRRPTMVVPTEGSPAKTLSRPSPQEMPGGPP